MNKREISFGMGKRLRSLREEKGISYQDLANALLDNYGIKISKDSLRDYEIDGDYRAKSKNLPNMGMRTEYLYALADFYCVSADYILGFSESKSIDVDIQNACRCTGLSEETVKMLSTFSSSDKTVSSFIARYFEEIIVFNDRDIESVCNCIVNAALANAISEKGHKPETQLNNMISAMNGVSDGQFSISALDAAAFYLGMAQDIMTGNIKAIIETMMEEMSEDYLKDDFIGTSPRNYAWRIEDFSEDDTI
jgi:hypothetical protein